MNKTWWWVQSEEKKKYVFFSREPPNGPLLVYLSCLLVPQLRFQPHFSQSIINKNSYKHPPLSYLTLYSLLLIWLLLLSSLLRLLLRGKIARLTGLSIITAH